MEAFIYFLTQFVFCIIWLWLYSYRMPFLLTRFILRVNFGRSLHFSYNHFIIIQLLIKKTKTQTVKTFTLSFHFFHFLTKKWQRAFSCGTLWEAESFSRHHILPGRHCRLTRRIEADSIGSLWGDIKTEISEDEAENPSKSFDALLTFYLFYIYINF